MEVNTFAHGSPQRLEDEFDGANRKNLRHFIHVSEANEDTILQTRASSELNLADGISEEESEKQDEMQNPTYYFVSPEMELAHRKSPSNTLAGQRQLSRIPTCAVFHKIASGKGVPHTFIGTWIFVS